MGFEPTVRNNSLDLQSNALNHSATSSKKKIIIYKKKIECSGIWTHDLRVKSSMLYQLSYTPYEITIYTYILYKLESNGIWTHDFIDMSDMFYHWTIDSFIKTKILRRMGFEPMVI